MTSKGGMIGVHQVRFWWSDHSGLEIEEAEFLNSQPANLTQNRIDALRRSALIQAFHANAPDVRKCTNGKARRAVMEQFLGSKRWRKIYEDIMK